MTAITEPGIHTGMDEAVYHLDPVEAGSLSSTWARTIMQPAGPAKFRHQMDSPREYRKVFEFGHAAHALVLGIGAPIARIPEKLLATNGAVSTKEAKQFVTEAREAGHTPLKAAEHDQVLAMAEAILENPDAVEALRGRDGDARHEVSAFRQDPETGMWLRGRFDSIHADGITDYKTIVDADPALFARRTAAELGYHMQAAWYLDMAAALGELDTDAPFTFVLQEKKAPYLTSVVDMSALFLHLGRERNRRAIDLYARCKATDTWPGYTGRAVAEPPKWLTDQEDEGLSADIEAELTDLINNTKGATS